MNRYRVEVLLAAGLTILCAIVWHWQAPGDTMAPQEVEAYLRNIEATLPLLADENGENISRLRAFGESDDGRPAYMVNLMRYHDVLQPGSDIPATFSGTPAQANAYYESKVVPLALKSGSLPVFVGNVYEPNVTKSHPQADRWDRVALMRYPSRRAFFELLTDPAYRELLPYKLGALHVALIPARLEAAPPDIRMLTIAIALIAFLAIGWTRAARGRATRAPRGA